MKMKLSLFYLTLLLAIIISIQTEEVYSCSMFKITKYGVTMVGNNEDFYNPNTRIWFEQGNQNSFGAVFVGFDDFWPQGGMNEAGLVYDIFSMPYLSIKDTVGKKKLPDNFFKLILKTCSTVEEVKSEFKQVNLAGFLENGLLLYVDKTGKYLIVVGDSLIIGNDQCYVQSNFNPSFIKNLDYVFIPFYQKGRKLLNERQDTSLNFCASVMDTMHQDWGEMLSTLYTSIYNLNEGLIYIYYYHDYKNVIKFNLKEELKKGDHIIKIPELFPNNIDGNTRLSKYNLIAKPILLLYNDSLQNDSSKFSSIITGLDTCKFDFRFEEKINSLGYEWLNKKNCLYAIEIFKLGVKKFPYSSNVYNSLGEAYMENKQYELALSNFKQSVKMNPNDTGGSKKIRILENLIN
jgi:tetratricopeptide (TPR) repeat protein